MQHTAQVLMEWLVSDFRCFGMRYQNWMPVIAGIVLLYIGYLMLRREPGRPRSS